MSSSSLVPGRLAGGFALMAFAAFFTPLHAADVNIFTDFSGSASSSNGYAGVAGNGWSGKWNLNRTGTGAFSANVVSQKLRVANNKNDGAGTQHVALNRNYDVTPLDLDYDYTVSFDLAFTTLTNFGAGDYMSVLEGGSNTSGLPTTSQFWGVFIDGTDGSINWYDASLGQAVSSGLAVATATTYSFTIALDPVDRTWTGPVTATDSGGSTSVTSSAINVGAGSVFDTASRTIRLYSRAVSDVDTATAITYDFDNLAIQQTAPIPEPSSFAFAAGAAVFITGLLRRRAHRQTTP